MIKYFNIFYICIYIHYNFLALQSSIKASGDGSETLNMAH